MPDWTVIQNKYEPERAGHWGSIFTISNGYFGTRGTDEESLLGEPATYVAGTFSEDVIGVDMLPNSPDWLFTRLKVDDTEIDLSKEEILEYRREYDLHEGIVRRKLRCMIGHGKTLLINSARFASQDNRHLGVLKYSVTPEDFSGHVELDTGFNCDAKFRGVNYLRTLSRGGIGSSVHVCSETTESKITIAETAVIKIIGARPETMVIEDGDRIFVRHSFDIKEGRTYDLTKTVAIYTSRDGTGDITRQSAITAETASREGFEILIAGHSAKWKELWKQSDIRIYGDNFAQLGVRFGMFHLISASNPDDDRVSLGAKLLSGDFYRHHVFWDTDLFIFPFLCAVFPERAKNMITYRYHTLDGARRKALEFGYHGACYPWESSDTGDEVSPKKWVDDSGIEHPISCWRYEIHCTCAVAWAVWDYYVITGDWKFLIEKGFEILFETARFWVSRCEWDEDERTASIRHVTGPDENHADVDNSAYINYLAKWNIRKAFEVGMRLKNESSELYTRLYDKLKIRNGEIERMRHTAGAIKVPYDSRRKAYIAFDGFDELKEADPVRTTAEISDESVLRTLQVVKQADVIMLMYLFRDIIPKDEIRSNWDYYVPKTAHNSSLSPCTHSVMASFLGMKEVAYKYFLMSARSDLDALRPDTEHGLHAAAMGGTWQAVIYGFAGVIFLEDKVKVHPSLPKKWQRFIVPLKWRGAEFTLDITRTSFRVRNNSKDSNLFLETGETEYIISPQEVETIRIPRH